MGENKLSRDYVEMAVINYRYCQYYSETHKQPLDYGTGVEYSSAEVHTVVQIAAQPGITVTEIARVTSRSKSAVSQITTRLEQKGLICNKKGLNRRGGLYVTDKGQELNDCYTRYAEKVIAPPLEKYVERFGAEAMNSFYNIMNCMISELSQAKKENE